jgi:hypothetical protein
MGTHWLKVSWNVHLARNREHTLWESALAWRPDVVAWKNEPMQVCRSNDEIVGM